MTQPTVAERAAAPLLDRHAEQAALERVLADARAGTGSSLVLRGGAGSGRTALLEYAVGQAADMRLARLAGIESESGLGFAALHRLLAPFLVDLHRLPVPQRDALRAAFGLVTADPPDRFLVGLAALTLLAGAAADQPLLLAVDDAHWLDQPTAELLGFVARRLPTEPIAFVVTVREPTDRCRPLEGLPARHLAALPGRHDRQQLVAAGPVPDRVLAAPAAGVPDPDTRAWHLAAAAGDPDGAAADELARCAARAGDRGDHGMESALLAALVVLELGLGRYGAALASALTVYSDDPPDTGTRILPDLVEAAVRAGNRGAARSAADRLAERARTSGTPLAAGLLAWCRALLATGTEAESGYQEAIDQLRHAADPSQLARAHLLYGEWLRRQRRRRDAREQLRTARDLFDALGSAGFVQRARGELLATGERITRRTGDVDVDAQLTPQETQVARLVTEGSSNRQVAAQLFISPSTVEYHLQKVFRKVGVSSRTQLARTLRDPDHGAAAPAVERPAKGLRPGREHAFG